MQNWQDDKQRLVALLRRLTAADLSVLAATLHTPDSQIATVQNSANDVLWSTLVELGFARELPLELDLPPHLRHVQPTSFALTEEGRAALPELLTWVMGETNR